MFSKLLKELLCTSFKFRHDVFLNVAHPLAVAFKESEIALLISFESLELRTPPTLFVMLQMLCNVVIEKGAKDPELVVILIMKLFAFLGLQEIVAAVLIAILDHELLKLLLTLGLQSEHDSILHIELGSLESVESLLEVLNVNSPGGGLGREVVERTCNLLLEVITLCHLYEIHYFDLQLYNCVICAIFA